MIALNPFEDALIEADKDNFIYLKARYLDKSQIVQADDYLQVSALLQTSTKRLSVADNFVDVMMAHPTFEKTIYRLPAQFNRHLFCCWAINYRC